MTNRTEPRPPQATGGRNGEGMGQGEAKVAQR